ncbi:merozoite surface protein 2-like [Procambarus clarkii]|uniref:merozoite surface protein 2-like n=1 Tax=Procambarus clarkii TaxID=6728 RepID=UPI003742BC80
MVNVYVATIVLTAGVTVLTAPEQDHNSHCRKQQGQEPPIPANLAPGTSEKAMSDTEEGTGAGREEGTGACMEEGTGACMEEGTGACMEEGTGACMEEGTGADTDEGTETGTKDGTEADMEVPHTSNHLQHRVTRHYHIRATNKHCRSRSPITTTCRNRGHRIIIVPHLCPGDTTRGIQTESPSRTLQHRAHVV